MADEKRWVAFDEDEWYPVWSVGAVEGPPEPHHIEVDAATLARWESAFEAFRAVQGEIRGLWDAHHPAPPRPEPRHYTITTGRVDGA
jgi:hypothetical protein